MLINCKICLPIKHILILTPGFFIFFGSFNLIDMFYLGKMLPENVNFFWQMLKLSLALSLLWLFIPGSLRKLLFLLLLIPFMLWGLINGGCLFLFGKKIDYAGTLALLNTYGGEMLGFAAEMLGFKSIAAAVLLVLISLFLLKAANHPVTLSFKKHFIIFIAAYSYLIISSCYVVDRIDTETFSMREAISDYVDYWERSSHLESYRFDGINDLNRNVSKKLYVVIIGESVNRYAMSVYGNKVQTTPFMDSIKSELKVFNNVVASDTTTAVMLNKILNFERKGEVYRGNLVDFFKSAGFKVYWVSAHSRYGMSDRYAHLINHADYVKYINENINSQKTAGAKNDSFLLPEIAKIWADDVNQKVVFIHMMGSHNYAYADRYPKGYLADN